MKPLPIPAAERDRPSRHGLFLGEALADLAKAGAVGTGLLEAMCATCAFRPGCTSNMMAATGSVALDCVLTGEVFGCHHGLKDGEPTRACAGWYAARQAPFDILKAAVATAAARLDAATGPDEIRAEFDAWLTRVDPDNRMDNYQQARAFLRDRDGAPRKAEGFEAAGRQPGAEGNRTEPTSLSLKEASGGG